MMRGMFVAALAIIVVGSANAQLSDDYIATKVHELSLMGETYVPPEAEQRGNDCSGGEIYDDGVSDGTSGVTNTNAGFVQLFEPQQLPFQYDTFCVCLKTSPTGSNQVNNANIVFYDDDGPDGGPGSLLGSVTRSITGIQSSNPCNFFQLNLADEAPLIATERVYIGMLFNREVYTGVSFGIDATLSTPDRPFYSTGNGTNFTSKEDGVFADTRAMMIRADGSSVCSDEVEGLLAQSSPKWDRVFLTTPPSLTCEAVPIDSAVNNLPYQVIPVSSPTGGLFTAEINALGSPVDTVMLLYCDPFDPLNPTANLIAYDDTDGPGNFSAFTASDGLVLEADTTYQVVVSSFSVSSLGGFRLCLGGDYTQERVCTATVSGSLGANSPHYDRIVSTANGSSCNGITADTVQDNMPYAAIPFELNTAGFLDISLVDSETTISDPVMTIYCDPFDPLNPGANVVAYDDNDGGGMMPAFNTSDLIDLQVDTRYWLVVTTWAGDDADGGDFEVCFGNNVNTQYPLEDCEADSIFGNTPSNSLDSWNGFSIDDAGTSYIYDNFNGLSDPIRAITWYGFIAPRLDPLSGPCSPGPNAFEIEFYSDSSGEPGGSVYSEMIDPAIIPTGIQYREAEQFQLVKYTAGLSSDVFLADGWFRITAQNASDCTMYWLNSFDGDGLSASSSPGGTTYNQILRDHAFCLSDAFVVKHSADTDSDFMINLSELLRVIQFFNSDGYHCDAQGEDGYAPGPGDQTCSEHNSDYNPADWEITLSELLRLIQFFNSGGYSFCAEGEDGFCPGL